MLDSLAGIFIGTYLLAIVSQGKTRQLIALTKRDRAFITWLIAIGILIYMVKIPALSGPAKMLILLSFIGLGLVGQKQIGEQVSIFWKQIGG